jgi:hypothetical protein
LRRIKRGMWGISSRTSYNEEKINDNIFILAKTQSKELCNMAFEC